MKHWETIAGLIVKHLTATLTAAEQDELNHWLLSSAKNKMLFDQFNNTEFLQKKLQLFNNGNIDEHWKQVREKIKDMVG